MLKFSFQAVGFLSLILLLLLCLRGLYLRFINLKLHERYLNSYYYIKYTILYIIFCIPILIIVIGLPTLLVINYPFVMTPLLIIGLFPFGYFGNGNIKI